MTRFRFLNQLGWIGRWLFQFFSRSSIYIEHSSTVKIVTCYQPLWSFLPFYKHHLISQSQLMNIGEETMRLALQVNLQKLKVYYFRKARGALKAVCYFGEKLPLDMRYSYPPKEQKEDEKVAKAMTDIYDKDGHLVCKVVGFWNKT